MKRRREELSPEQRRRVGDILLDVLEKPPSERADAVAAACDGLPALRAEVESLLRAHDRSEGFLESLDTGGATALLGAGGPGFEDGDGIGPYTITGRLGTGGMGVVYRAEDTRLGRSVALKFLPPHRASDPAARARLVTEARAAAALNDPHIGVVHEIGESEAGRTYIAMACYEGGTLREKLRTGPLAVAEAVHVARGIARGLEAAHGRGITHRDIKPSNVIVTARSEARIVDFGIAAFAGSTSGTAAAAATVPYMSPEQSHGETAGPATDVWSLGVVLYEMLAGERPFRGDTGAAVIDAIRKADPPSLVGVPAALRGLVESCLQVEPSLRPTAARLADRLGAIEDALRSGRTRSVALPAAAIAVAVAVILAVRALMPVAPVSAGPALAVLPFEPTVPDTSLERLGRDLSVTLSSTLRDAGGLPVLDASTVLAGGRAGLEARPFERARELGAGRVVHGRLVRTGDRVRLDATLSDADGLAIASVFATAGPDDVVTLTDSVTSALLRQVWRREAQSLPDRTSLTTRPVPALRAYIDGEQALARSDYVGAVAAFERAFDADSSFWFAYWRSLYPRVHESVPPADTARLRRVFEQRASFPPPDRLLLESRLARDNRSRSALLREVIADHPHYWPGWFDYGNHLVHFGPFDGTEQDAARAALERVVALNPDFNPAWEHLLWIALMQRDTSLAAEAFERVSRPEFMPIYTSLLEILRAGGRLPDVTARRIASIADFEGGPGTLEQAATGFMPFGFFKAQVDYAGIVASGAASPDIAAMFRWGRAAGWAARGAWDSAFVDLDGALRISPTHRLANRARGLAALGAALGAIAPDSAARRRPDLDRFAAPPTAAQTAEEAWLDGVLSALRLDPAGVTRARASIAAARPAFAGLLDRSLAGLELFARGDTAAAGSALADIEEDNASRSLHVRFGADHPFLPAIHRSLASDWLLAAGDTARAARLLTWHEAILWSDFYPVEIANRVAEPVALLRRARIEEGRQQFGPATRHYHAFLDRYDLAPPGHAGWPAEAIESLARIAAGR